MALHRLLFLWVALAVASATLAEPKIFSVTPSSGPAAGGTEVTILGEGFLHTCGPIDCPANQVRFNSVLARQTFTRSDTMITAVTPPSVAGTVDVTLIHSSRAVVTLPRAFTFVGAVPAQSDRVLLPILTPPVRGAFGSEFRTTLDIASRHRGFSLYGLNVVSCPLPEATVCRELEWPIEFMPNERLASFNHVQMNGTPGRFLYVGAGETDAMAVNLRVQDVSRAQLNFGTEIPVVRERDFVNGPIVLLGVPTDPRFRSTLRVYGTNATFVRVTIDERPTITLPLRPGATFYDPAYAQFADFPTSGSGTTRVKIEPPISAAMPPQEPTPYPIWAFITVTNNETQSITTITPRP